MANIAPFFINSPLMNGKSPNILFADVYQSNMSAVSAANISINDGIIYLPLSGYYFPKRITSGEIKFDYTAGVAGTKGVYTISTAACTPVVGKVYKIQIISNDGSVNQVIPVISSSAVAATLASDINTAILNADQGGFFTSTVSGTTVTINESNLYTQGFAIIIFGDSTITTAVSTVAVAAFGTLAQVQLYKPTITSGGPFSLYQWTLNSDAKDYTGAGSNAGSPVVIQIWADTTGSNFSTASTALQQFGDNGTFWPTTYCTVAQGQMFNLPK